MQDPVYEEAYQGHTIKIYHDPDTESPREWSNLGKLICWHRRYRLGDSHPFDSPDALLRDLSGVTDQSDLSIEQLRERAERKAILLPVFLYDHSGLAMNTIGFHCPSIQPSRLCLRDARRGPGRVRRETRHQGDARKGQKHSAR